MSPMLIVMGVSGSGKSTIASALASSLDWPFLEGDDLHPAQNIAKMRSGVPLDDDDRWPWLNQIADWMTARDKKGEPGIITCSALKRSYRDFLVNRRPGLLFVYLKTSAAAAEQRFESRPGHWLTSSLVSSQFGDLQEPGADEPVMIVDAQQPVPAILDEIRARLSLSRNSVSPS